MILGPFMLAGIMTLNWYWFRVRITTRHALKAVIGERAARVPLHMIKAALKQQNGKLPDNFHRDSIREHRVFGPAVRNALASYKWN
jgi:hypothetical protein